MPNHVTNRISFRGDPEAIHRMLEAVKNDEEGYGSIDFNKILPMPKELNIESGSRTTEGIKLYDTKSLQPQRKQASADGFHHR